MTLESMSSQLSMLSVFDAENAVMMVAVLTISVPVVGQEDSEDSERYIFK